MILNSSINPYFYEGKYATGVGSPHIPKDSHIWPISLVMQALTTENNEEII